jgi:hypothetical protein
MQLIQIGTLVEHRVWGRGKVLALSGQNVQAYFPALETDPAGPVKLVREVVLMIAPVQSDAVLDLITGLPKPKKAKKAKADEGGEGASSAGPKLDSVRTRKRPVYDLERAIHWFEQEYPGGFENETLIREEIRFKRDAHQLFVDRLGGGLGRALLDAGSHAEAATLLTVLYQSTTIPSRYEIMAAHDGLKVPDAGARLLDALLGFLDTARADAFVRLADAVGSLPAPSERSRILTWPNVTILPFLGDPSRFIVIKPELFRKIAARMDGDLPSSATIQWGTYQRVLDLSHRLRERLAALGAIDFIDVQTFVWATRPLA